ncbi:hypothetical protein [Halospeciosus flavus]|uniref:hypothetical protein n=1 Tax=Halospeciosus flavus TaxID=3032283 RepID=UPI0036D291C0
MAYWRHARRSFEPSGTGRGAAVVVAGVAYLLGLPDVLWWPQALTAFWAFAVAVVASVVAAALGASA